MTELESALQECNKVASEGYELAKDYFKKIKKSIVNSEEILKKAKKDFEKSKYSNNEVKKQFSEQILKIQDDLQILKKQSDIELKDRKKRLEKFSITLFGRTMAGKSTLMEILTNGDGKSIGNGSQRTTRDVRSYRWNGIEIVDVPGIAAFEGADDEKVALESAKHGDLILFLITDDAPQELEAQCLAKVYSVGKPVLGICNVKQCLDGFYLKMYLKSPVCGTSKEERIRLEELMKQFDQMYHKYYPDKTLPFKVTNLNARYLANKEEFKEYSKELIEKSNFKTIEKYIINKIIKDGVFLRKRNFNEAVSVPLVNLIDVFLIRSSNNSIMGRTFLSKQRDFTNWYDNFHQQICGKMKFVDGKQNSINIGPLYRSNLLSDFLQENCRINTFINEISTELNKEYDEFVDEYYEREDASKVWNEIVKARNIDKRIKIFCDSINAEANEYIRNLADELNQDINYLNSNFIVNTIVTESVFDYKRTARWIGEGFLAVGAILTLFSYTTPVAPIFLIFGTVSSIISWLLESKAERISKQKQKLLEQIKNNTDNLRIDLKLSLTKWYLDNIEDAQLKPLENYLQCMTNSLFTVADAQKELAWDFNNQNKELTKDFIINLLKNINLYDKYFKSIKDVARIPNKGICIVLFDGCSFPKTVTNKIKDFLDEPVFTVSESDDKLTIFSHVIQREAKLSFEEKIGVVHVENYENLNSSILTKIKLAQQLSGLMATK